MNSWMSTPMWSPLRPRLYLYTHASWELTDSRTFRIATMSVETLSHWIFIDWYTQAKLWFPSSSTEFDRTIIVFHLHRQNNCSKSDCIHKVSESRMRATSTFGSKKRASKSASNLSGEISSYAGTLNHSVLALCISRESHFPFPQDGSIFSQSWRERES